MARIVDNDGKVVAFACTEEDMRAGNVGPLPRDPRAHRDPLPDEAGPLKTMLYAYQELKRLGWRDAIYAPQDGSWFLAIEAGSSGVHECQRDDDGHFWSYDGDLWPASPILFREFTPDEESARRAASPRAGDAPTPGASAGGGEKA